MTAKTNNIRLLVTGGGTGGHIFPIIAVTTEFKKLIPVAEPEIYFLGPANFGIDNLTQSGIKTVIIPAGKIPRYPTVAIFSEILKIIASLFLGALQMWRLMPDVVFSKGGFGGFSSVFAAWLFRIPVIIHESDAVPGLANRLCARVAKKDSGCFGRQSGFRRDQYYGFRYTARTFARYGSCTPMRRK